MVIKIYWNLIGKGYDQAIDNDVLLLDINNNDEYMWTNIFDLSAPKSTLPTSSSPPQQPNYKSIIIGAVVGSLIGGIFLSFGGFYLYKWNKNRKRQRQALPIPGNEVVKDTDHEEVKDTDQEVLEIPTLSNNYRQEIISTTPAINNVYKQNMLPMLPVAENENSTNNEIYNERSSLQNIDVKEVIQVIKQEVMQDLKQELAQNKKHN